jgi:SAM-dependent methyltransferase
VTTPSEERLGFDAVPEIYDRVRPSYPESLFDELFAYVPTPPERARVLEIGAGTGKATRSLLGRRARVTAVEIGSQLAAFLRSNLGKEYAGPLDVIHSSFEDCELPKGAFDAVVSATAFHWVDPSVRLTKSHAVLRTGGALAIIMTNQIASDTDRGYFARSQPIYRRYFPDEKSPEIPGEDVVPLEHEEVRASGLFDDVTLLRYRWDQTYTSTQYADLVRSYSGTQMMEPEPREAMISDLCEVIDKEFGGSMTRPLVITLTLGRKPD